MILIPISEMKKKKKKNDYELNTNVTITTYECAYIYITEYLCMNFYKYECTYELIFG